MFAVDCPTCGGTRLVTTSQITRTQNTGTSIRAHFTCVCGLDGIWITGRRAGGSVVVWAADAEEAAA